MPTPCLSINTRQLNTFEIGTGKSPCLVVSKAAEEVIQVCYSRKPKCHVFGINRPSVNRRERMLSELNHLTLAVRDLGRSFDFYAKVLGFRPRARWSSGAYLSLGTLWLCLSVDDNRAERLPTDYTHYAFTIKQGEFSKFVEKAHCHGVVEWKLK